jgi:iron complex transport system ATP-binding protein
MSLEAEALTLSYGARVVADNMNFSASRADIISIIGPNGSGKSTLLKALGRLLKPARGVVLLDGKDIQKEKTALIARKMAILPQAAGAPGDLTVYDLVRHGRMPYQKFFAAGDASDLAAITRAVKATRMEAFLFRRLDTLSGGERQRAWLAMALAQEPQILLLDEPTTFLDIHHQLEMMKLISRLYKELSITIIMVLHDLNHAARFSNRIVAVKDGRIIRDGGVAEVFREEVLSSLYEVRTQVVKINQCGEEHLYCLVDDLAEGAEL